MTRLFPILFPLLLLGAGFLGCDGGEPGNNDAGVDAISDGDADAGELELPFQPPPIATPLRDEPYLQEFNHTSNEVEAGIGPLVSVRITPPPLAEFGFFDELLQVTPRGFVRHEGDGPAQIVSIDPADGDLLAAEFLDDRLVLAGPRHLYFCHDGLNLERIEAPEGVELQGLAPGNGVVYLLCNTGIGDAMDPGHVRWPEGGLPVSAALAFNSQLILADSEGIEARSPFLAPMDEAIWRIPLPTGPVVGLVEMRILPLSADLVVVGDEGLAAYDLSGETPRALDVPEFAADRVPLLEPTAAAPLWDGGFVVTTRGGAYRIMDRGQGPEWRVYNAERWLPDEDVRAVATEPGLEFSPFAFATAGGLARVSVEEMTLEEKLAPFLDRIVLRHDRDGAVADSHLLEKGDLSTNVPWDSDNDGGWTCYWLMAECYRYRVTGDPQAKAHFDKSLSRMLSFRTLTGTEHFLARAVIHKEGCVLDDCDNPDDGEWFTSPDGEWWVKGDTSNDEVTSHMFMMGPAYDLCADEAQKEAIRAHVDGIIGGIVDHGYQLIDLDGECTTYGQFDPAYVNESFDGAYGDGGHRSVQLLGALNLALYLTGDPKYQQAKDELITLHHYDENAVGESEYPFRPGSGDADELGSQGFFALLFYEADPVLRAQWMEGWNKTYEHLRLQQGALWDMLHASFGGAEADLSHTVRWLRLAPVDMIRWNQHNAHRQDLILAPDYYHDDGRMRSDGFILPYDERRCDRWNTDQFRVDGGMGGMIEMDGADVLMPYWMGRYYEFIQSTH